MFTNPSNAASNRHLGLFESHKEIDNHYSLSEYVYKECMYTYRFIYIGLFTECVEGLRILHSFVDF